MEHYCKGSHFTLITAISTPFQRRFNAVSTLINVISTPFRRRFNAVSTPNERRFNA